MSIHEIIIEGVNLINKEKYKNAFEYFKKSYEKRKEMFLNKVNDNPKSPTHLLDAMSLIHILAWLRISEAYKDKSICPLYMAQGMIEMARVCFGPLISGLASWAAEKNIPKVQKDAMMLIDTTNDLETTVKNSVASFEKQYK